MATCLGCLEAVKGKFQRVASLRRQIVKTANGWFLGALKETGRFLAAVDRPTVSMSNGKLSTFRMACLQATLVLVGFALAAAPMPSAAQSVTGITATVSSRPGAAAAFQIDFNLRRNLPRDRYIIVSTGATAPAPASPAPCTFAFTGTPCVYQQTTAQTQSVALASGTCANASASTAVAVAAQVKTTGELRLTRDPNAITAGDYCLKISEAVGLIAPPSGNYRLSAYTYLDAGDAPKGSGTYTIPSVPTVTVVVENKILGNSGGLFKKDIGRFTYVGLAHLGGINLGFYATDNPTVSNQTGASLPCNKAKDSLFPFGDTIVTCTATDSAGNTGTAQFTINVRQPLPGEVPPTITVVFEHKVLGNTGGLYEKNLGTFNYVGFPRTGKNMVFFATDKATQPTGSFVPAWDTTILPCTPATKSLFPLGNTTVTCTTTDAAGKRVAAQFTINVREPRPGEIIPNLVQPDDSKVAPQQVVAPVLLTPTPVPVLAAPTVAPVSPTLQGVIKVVRAIYGENCKAPLPRADVTAHIATACNGKTSCVYPVNHLVIGDTAPNCAKSYAVAYQCGATNLTAMAAPEASGKTVQLACAPGVR